MSSISMSPAAAAQFPIDASARLGPNVSESTIKEGSWSAWAISKTVTYHANEESYFPNLVAKIIARFFVNAEEAGKFLGTRTEAAAFLLGQRGGDEKVARTEAVRIADRTLNNPIYKNLRTAVMAEVRGKKSSAAKKAKLIPLDDKNDLGVINMRLKCFQERPSQFTHKVNFAIVIQQDMAFRPLEERYRAQFKS